MLNRLISVLCVIVALITQDPRSRAWSLATLLLYAVPLLGSLSKRTSTKVYSGWFGVFLLLQLGVSYYGISHSYHLPPNYRGTVDVQGGIPGIEGMQKISVDAEGFRSWPPINYANHSKFRIFVMGASTTAQIFIDDQKTWTFRLQEDLSRSLQSQVEVSACALSGIRLPEIYDNFREIVKLRPDMVIFLLGVNDWNVHIARHFNPELAQRSRFYRRLGLETHEVEKIYLANSIVGRAISRFISPQVKTPLTENRKENGEYYSKQNNSLAKTDVRQFAPQALDEEYESYLNKLGSFCRSAHQNCVFLTQPNQYKEGVSEAAKRTFWMTPPNVPYTLDFTSMSRVARFYNESLIAFARRNGFAYCDLDAQVGAGSFPGNFYDDVHFNLQGAERVATALTPCLTPIASSLQFFRNPAIMARGERP